jgi:myosin heavy subunit
MIKSIFQSISRPSPARQPIRTNTAQNQHAAGVDHLALQLQQANSKLQQTSSELQQANNELQQTNNDVRRLKCESRNFQTELQASQCEILRLQDKERSMRDFLIENNHNQIVSDREVCERFTQLRQRIQRLASNKAYIIEEFNNLPFDEKSIESRYTAALWEASPKPGRLLILRSLIFQILHAQILSNLLFDIDERASPHIAATCSHITSLNQAFNLFEGIMSDRDGKKSQLCHSSILLMF